MSNGEDRRADAIGFVDWFRRLYLADRVADRPLRGR